MNKEYLGINSGKLEEKPAWDEEVTEIHLVKIPEKLTTTEKRNNTRKLNKKSPIYLYPSNISFVHIYVQY